MPLQLAAALDELLAQFGIAAAVGDVPLACGDDLKRLVALLEELHRGRDLAWLTDKVIALAQHCNDSFLRGVTGGSGDGLVVLPG